MATTFDEEQFPPTVSFGMVGGPNFNTTVLVSTEGYEHRNRHWQQAIRSYACDQRIRTQYELDQLVEFFYARRGASNGFRFKDWIDYKHDMGSTPNRQSCYPATGDGSNTDFQLVKTYSDAAFSHLRVITKPVASTIKVYVDGVEQTGGGTHYTLDDTTGGIVFEAGFEPPLDDTVEWEGEFDVPCRFDGDDMPVQIEHFKLYTWGSIKINEVRVPAFLQVPQTVSTSGFHDARFPEKIVFGVTGGPNFQTVVSSTTGRHEARQQQWTASKATYQASHELQDFDEFSDLLNFFYARYGRAFSFRFKDWTDYKQRMQADDSPSSALYAASSLDIAVAQANLADMGLMTEALIGTDMQLQKDYVSGGATYYRDITKIVSGSLFIYGYIDSLGVIADPFTEGVNYSVDLTTGIVTWITEPYNAVFPTRLLWQAEFDVHARLDADEMAASITNFGRFDWNAIQVSEVRE